MDHSHPPRAPSRSVVATVTPFEASGRQSLTRGLSTLGTEGHALSPPPPSGHDHIDFAAAAFGTDQPLAPVRDSHFGTVAPSLFGGIGLDLVTAISTPYDEANAGRS